MQFFYQYWPLYQYHHRNLDVILTINTISPKISKARTKVSCHLSLRQRFFDWYYTLPHKCQTLSLRNSTKFILLLFFQIANLSGRTDGCRPLILIFPRQMDDQDWLGFLCGNSPSRLWIHSLILSLVQPSNSLQLCSQWSSIRWGETVCYKYFPHIEITSIFLFSSQQFKTYVATGGVLLYYQFYHGFLLPLQHNYRRKNRADSHS